MVEKRFHHDCDLCIFLGQYNQFDLYYHRGNGRFRASVLARYGSLYSNYNSVGLFDKSPNGTWGGSSIPELVEARDRAKQKNLPGA